MLDMQRKEVCLDSLLGKARRRLMTYAAKGFYYAQVEEASKKNMISTST